MPESRKKNDFSLMGSAHLGLTVVITVGLMMGAGHLVDTWLHTSPIFAIVGALCGAGAGMYYVVRSVDELQREERDDEEK